VVADMFDHMRTDRQVVDGIGPVDRLYVEAAGLAVSREFVRGEPGRVYGGIRAELDRLPACEFLDAQPFEQDAEDAVSLKGVATGAARHCAIGRGASLRPRPKGRAVADRATRP